MIRIEHAPTAEQALDEEWEGIEEDDDAPKTEVVRQLEELARCEVKTPRLQSERERE